MLLIFGKIALTILIIGALGVLFAVFAGSTEGNDKINGKVAQGALMTLYYGVNIYLIYLIWF